MQFTGATLEPNGVPGRLIGTVFYHEAIAVNHENLRSLPVSLLALFALAIPAAQGADNPAAGAARTNAKPASAQTPLVVVSCEPQIHKMTVPANGVVKRGEAITLDGKCLGDQAGMVTAQWSKEAPAPSSGSITQLEIRSWTASKIVAVLPATTKGVRYQGIKLAAQNANQKDIVLAPEISRLKYEPNYIVVMLDGNKAIAQGTTADFNVVTTNTAFTGHTWTAQYAGFPAAVGSARSASLCDASVCVDHLHNGGILGIGYAQQTAVEYNLSLASGLNSDEPEEKRGRIASCSFSLVQAGIDQGFLSYLEKMDGKKLYAEKAFPPQITQCKDYVITVRTVLNTVASKTWYKLKVMVYAIE